MGMDDATLEKNANIVAQKISEGYTEEQARGVMASAGYAEADVAEIMRVARILQKNQSKAPGLEAAFGPLRPPMAMPPYGYPAPLPPPPKKGHKKLIACVAIIIVAIAALAMLAFVKPELVGLSQPIVSPPHTDNKNTTGGGVIPPEEPAANYTAKATPVKKIVTYDLDIEISKVTLNDNKDMIDIIEIAYTPKLSTVTKDWDLKFQIMQGGFAVSQWSYDPEPAYVDAKIKAITSPTKLQYEVIHQNLYRLNWHPYPIESGQYELRVNIINPTTKEVAYILTKDFSLGEAAPKVQE